MPELPEVELVVKSLDRLISGRRIAAAVLRRRRLAPDLSPAQFSARLRGATVNFIHRRGKHILFDLSRDRTLIVHLRMTGRFMFLPADRENPKFTHAEFYFEDENRLVFADQRHFGFMRLVDTPELDEAAELKKLAPEPFAKEFSPAYLAGVLGGSTRRIKDLLLDQTKVCGLGNIYAAEALFLARINPETPARSISRIKSNRLHRSIREVLAESIAHGSTLNADPEDIDRSYYGGGYENHWRVYDREDKPCPNCRARIKRIKYTGRSSYFCPRCQRINKKADAARRRV